MVNLLLSIDIQRYTVFKNVKMCIFYKQVKVFRSIQIKSLKICNLVCIVISNDLIFRDISEFNELFEFTAGFLYNFLEIFF